MWLQPVLNAGVLYHSTSSSSLHFKLSALFSPCRLSCNFLSTFLFQMPGWCSHTAYQTGERSQAKTNSWWHGFNYMGSLAQLGICLGWTEWEVQGWGTGGCSLCKQAGGAVPKG